MRVHIMVWVPVTLYLLLLVGVNSQQMCTNAIDFVSDGNLGPAACSGYLTADGDNICGYFDNDAARRACWERDLNTNGNRRAFRCRVEDGTGVDMIDQGEDRYYIEKGTIGEACDSGSPDCFRDCHAGPGNRVVTVNADPNICGGNIKDAAIACDDVDECLEGVLRNCQGPFDKDCSQESACAPNEMCTNSVGSFRCDCRPGYAGNSLGPGCVDIDECDPPVGNCGLDMCQNTIGSFVCLCRDGHSWDPAAEECERDSCSSGDLPIIPNSSQGPGSSMYLDTQDYSCNPGYEPAVPASISTTCRGGSSWCNCASLTCKRVKCGTPPTDGNAYTPMTSGVYGDRYDYTCLPGFRANGAATYSLDCQADGTWSGPPVDRCEDVNECEASRTCPANSMCYNTAGSYICICDPGYTSSGTDCTEISCDPIPNVHNAERTTHSGVADGFFKMVVTYRCEDGYTASKSPHHVIKSFDIECKLDGCWSPLPIPKCIPVSCGDPGTLPYATRHGATFYYKDDVSYTCVDGFRPSDYATRGSSTHRFFVITCGQNGVWSDRPYCVDINECLELDSACGPGDGHYCINKKGGYTCSCAPYYRLDNTGTTCIGIPAHVKDIDKPCEFYHTLNFCNYGECYYDGGGLPRCKCNKGYKGAFCDIHDKFEFSLTFIMAVAGLILCAFTLLMCIVLACYVCSRHHHPVPVPIPHSHYSPTYAAPPPPPVIRPAYRKPRFFALRSSPPC